jgi:hypothetical protein
MSKRAESGTIQFGDDWPGLFLRGDDAFFYAQLLDELLAALKEGREAGSVTREAIEGIKEFLLSVKVDEAQTPTKLQPFEKCLDEGRVDFLSAPPGRWLRFRSYENLDLLLSEGTPLTVLFPDGTVSDGIAQSTAFLRADSAIQAWGVVVDGSWYDLIDLKVDRESLPVELRS